jgi:uncharacterized protein with GYD domain
MRTRSPGLRRLTFETLSGVPEPSTWLMLGAGFFTLWARSRIAAWIKAHAADKLAAMRGPGESYSDVILRLVKTERGAAIGCRGSAAGKSSKTPLGSVGYREGAGQGCAHAAIIQEETMATYIALFNLTEAGIKAAKDSPRRLDAAKKLLADMGGEMKQFYMVMGEFDFVGICEAPDDAVMARYVLQLGGLGFVRTKTLKAFPETAYREIIRSLG